MNLLSCLTVGGFSWTELSLSLTVYDYCIHFMQEREGDLFLFIQINSVSAAVYDKHSIELLLW